MRLSARIRKWLNAGSHFTMRQMVRWLWVTWKGNRLQAILNAAIGLLGVAVSLASVWAVQRAIDVASGSIRGNIYWAVATMALLILCDFGLNISHLWIKNILGVRAQNRMQQQMLDRLLRAEWRGREARHSGDVINRLENDVQTVVAFLTETLPNTLSALALFVGAFFYLFTMDVWLACITVAMLPLFALLSRIYVARMRQYSRRVRNTDSRIQSILQEAIQHSMLIKTLEATPRMVGRLESTQSELRHHVRQRTAFSVASQLIINAGFSLSYLLAFLWSAVRLSRHTISFGQMTAFLQLVYRIQGPVRNLTRLAPAFVSVFTAAERIMELEDDPEEQQGASIRLASPCGVRFTDVTYCYTDDSSAVLSHLSFDFRPGTATAILGETGAGKTTLVRLILALVSPTEGSVEVYNSFESQTVSPLHRTNFVYVPQGNTLLSGTIRDNLLLACPGATDQQLWSALDTACAQFVSDLPQGLDTVCTEAGGGLSEGQAQRLAIARALLRDRAVLLFDEATSALDPDTERQLLHNILSNHQKTVIFITHRPVVVDYCDAVLRL